MYVNLELTEPIVRIDNCGCCFLLSAERVFRVEIVPLMFVLGCFALVKSSEDFFLELLLLQLSSLGFLLGLIAEVPIHSTYPKTSDQDNDAYNLEQRNKESSYIYVQLGKKYYDNQ